MTSKKKFSIIVPVYYNMDCIKLSVKRLQEVSKGLDKYEVEFIFVDDGSGDNSLDLLKQDKEKDDRITIIKLSKNFGAFNAVLAGLHYATGNVVGIIAADMQDPPELFVEMLDYWENGAKVVMAVRNSRKDPLLSKIFSAMYYFLLRKFALKNYPRGGFDFVVIDENVVNDLIKMNEKNTNLMNLIYWLGYNRVEIEYDRSMRVSGKSRWTFAKRFKLLIDSFVSFSYAPIKWISFIGVMVSFISFVYGLLVIYYSVVHNIVIPGWASLASILSFLLGLIVLMLGIIGEYLWRILDESRERPPFVIDEVI